MPFTKIRPKSETSFATVLLFINLDTFKNLSNRIIDYPLVIFVNFIMKVAKFCL